MQAFVFASQHGELKVGAFHKKMSEWTLDHGNRCGHRPDGSTLGVAKGLLTAGQGAQPKILKMACEVIDGMFHNPKKFLKSIFFRDERKVRSEFREAICKVLKTIMKFLDLATLRVAVPDENGVLKNITLGVIAQHAGLSIERCTSVWKYLQDKGIARSQQQYEVVDGQKKGLASFKWLALEFFDSIGLGSWFASDRKKRVELAKTRKFRAQVKKQEKSASRPAQAEQKMRLKGTMGKIFGQKKAHQSPQAKERELANYDEYQRQLQVEACRLHQETKLPLDQCYDIALRTIRRY